eukprot:2141144-Pleurochrysis_carterae.AAC.1
MGRARACKASGCGKSERRRAKQKGAGAGIGARRADSIGAELGSETRRRVHGKKGAAVVEQGG